LIVASIASYGRSGWGWASLEGFDVDLDESIGQSIDQTVEVIGFGRRFVAFIIDGVILWLVSNLLDVSFATIGANV
jgi:hypothetical protein